VDLLTNFMRQGMALHKQGRFDEAEVIYNRILNRQPFHDDLLFLLGDLYIRKEYNGLGVNLLEGLVSRNPTHPYAWCNLGIGYRKENDYENAMRCWNRSLEVSGETPEVCNNIAGLYADRAEPLKALEWLQKSLEARPDDVEGNWLKALALLSLKRWDEGWKGYEWRRKLPNWDSREIVKAPDWDGSYVDSLYIHGEQGVGDEVMFACCLPFVKAKHVTVEVHRKVAPLIQKSFPDFDVVTEPHASEYDAKIPIGSLVRLLGFNTEPYLNPDPWRIEFYREELRKLGPGPYVDVGWRNEDDPRRG
jgi:tetratricopeptide (TPR) repeat protein